MSDRRAEHARRQLRLGLVADMLRNLADNPPTDDRELRRSLYRIAKALTAQPGVDGSCRRCGATLKPQYRGRPRVYCDEHTAMRQEARKNRVKGIEE